MTSSTDRMITSHVGSLPRPLDLFAMLRARSSGQPCDEAASRWLRERVALRHSLRGRQRGHGEA